MLLLFDIDLTLLTSGGAGEAALHLAGREVIGPSYSHEGLQVAGRLDRLIFADVLTLNGVAADEATQERVCERYTHHLGEQLTRTDRKAALPGVHDVLASLREREDVVVGVLTGNYERSGRMKLDAVGIDASQFVVQAWCDFAPRVQPKRADLVDVAMRQCEQRTTRRLRGKDVVVIGDTHHDVDCAKAHGCFSVGVATGRTSAAELAAAGADCVLESMADVGATLRAFGVA
jgi:phosphoglycolate phosphatase-like HAD superfamily hydrolase